MRAPALPMGNLTLRTRIPAPIEPNEVMLDRLRITSPTKPTGSFLSASRTTISASLPTNLGSPEENNTETVADLQNGTCEKERYIQWVLLAVGGNKPLDQISGKDCPFRDHSVYWPLSRFDMASDDALRFDQHWLTEKQVDMILFLAKRPDSVSSRPLLSIETVHYILDMMLLPYTRDGLKALSKVLDLFDEEHARR